MKVIEKGHIYEPCNRSVSRKINEFMGISLGDNVGKDQTITFINKEPGGEHAGTTTQEVIRILIDRTRHCANCMPHPNNERIVYHLRMALVLHEARALERKTEKGELRPEYVSVSSDGHFALAGQEPDYLDTPELVPHRHDWDRVCNHPSSEQEKKGFLGDFVDFPTSAEKVS